MQFGTAIRYQIGRGAYAYGKTQETQDAAAARRVWLHCSGGAGLTTRKSCEFVVIGKRGKPRRLAADVREAILSPVRQHSRKPDEVYRRIERYCGGPGLDLFGRESRDGWTVYGDQATKFDHFRRPSGDRRELAVGDKLKGAN